ncbi:DUF7669 domain-containing protein [Nocardioides halotolerans]|uniref:DUF7669 domain-containing protein n=1 Tax=Nocardioides halotolerans TaxID=433660 RepID=UPI00042953BA|nr:hypothetical protein [Nocardioides halotolerans]
MADTIWARLEECVGYLSEPFRASEIVGWFRRHYPEVKEQSLRAHIQVATSNASAESRGMFANRRPLITRVEHGVYRRYDGEAEYVRPGAHRRTAMTRRPREVDIEDAVDRYLRHRDPTARYTSFDYCFNHFQQRRSAVAGWDEPTGMEASCFHLGFYLASWGMLRGSSELLQRSARHLVPLVETVADAPAELWDLDLNRYDAESVDLIYRTSLEIRRALRPVEASDILVTKVMLGVFGCVPAFDTYFKKGFGVSTFNTGSLHLVGEFYRANAARIDGLREPTLDFTTGLPSSRLYTRAKVVDMVFFVEGGTPLGTTGGDGGDPSNAGARWQAQEGGDGSS